MSCIVFDERSRGGDNPERWTLNQYGWKIYAFVLSNNRCLNSNYRCPGRRAG